MFTTSSPPILARPDRLPGFGAITLDSGLERT
jgi:hypothetical protein